MLKLIKVNWSAPTHIHAYTTTRYGGCSVAAYQGLNLGLHVGDEPSLVAKNRMLLSDRLSLPTTQCWLNQTHSTRLLQLEKNHERVFDGDAAWTLLKNKACIVMTADCLPILVTDKQGSFVCAIHAGWRGLCDGIIEQSIATICCNLNVLSQDLLVWLGPCIGKTAFAVGHEVRTEFMQKNPQAAEAFTAYQDRYLADLHLLARQRLAVFRVAEITNSAHCTFNEPELFYSYRRDGKTGRMASLIWID